MHAKKKQKMGQEIDTFDGKYKTNDVCPKSGTWICKDHPAVEVFLREGEIFPKCHHVAGHYATWYYLVG